MFPPLTPLYADAHTMRSTRFVSIFCVCLVAFLLCLTTQALAVFSIPEPTGYVNDAAKVLTDDDYAELTGLCRELKEKTGVELAILTVPSLEGMPSEEAGLKVFRAWKIGEKGKNNGLLILVAINDHKMRTEIGYGLEGVITDGRSGEIQRDVMRPWFKQNEYGKGILAGATTYAHDIAKAYNVELNGAMPQPPKPKKELLDWFYIAIAIVSFIWLISSRRRGSYYDSGYSGWSSWGGFSSGDSDFGGFGGGDCGGGGSSSDW